MPDSFLIKCNYLNELICTDGGGMFSPVTHDCDVQWTKGTPLKWINCQACCAVYEY